MAITYLGPFTSNGNSESCPEEPIYIPMSDVLRPAPSQPPPVPPVPPVSSRQISGMCHKNTLRTIHDIVWSI